MDSLSWLLWSLRVWFDGLCHPGPHAYLVTLESPRGHRWQAKVMASGHCAARQSVMASYPQDHIIDVQLQG